MRAMSNFLQEKKGIMFFLMIILFLLIGLGYVYKIKPIQDTLDTTRMNVQGMEAEIQILNAQIAKVQEANSEEETESEEPNIEHFLPFSSNLDDILIQLSQVEVATGNKINSISFATTEGTLSEADIQTMRKGYEIFQATDDGEAVEGEETNGESAESDTTESGTVDEGTTENTQDPAAQNPPPAIPGVENVKLVTVNLSVTSPTLAHFRQFLTGIENLERITRIESYSFNTKQEMTKPENEEEEAKPIPITIGLQISTFYYIDGQNQ